MKSTLVTVLAFLLIIQSVHAWRQYWCAYKGKGCPLPGIGPTYKCGDQIWDGDTVANYLGVSGNKFWRANDYSQETLNNWEACCSSDDTSKGVCYHDS
ncbi:uncharacterized protein BX664DRAFT_326433 [Halteromyces radiatus]|uniref:uncharacterized protein n=1 Tax=Halteromyces radiatus TaxID=101107 RepID=UPI002220DD8F|nr:uncharacterized protein BX664DRAFT_326433 [Halteromyces radiatus]KAI8097461.1 hypothetical protein BX664DRAFT_326433 [Halteromyces radiatus]